MFVPSGRMVGMRSRSAMLILREIPPLLHVQYLYSNITERLVMPILDSDIHHAHLDHYHAWY